MTRQSSIERAAQIDKPWPKVIGRFRVGDEAVDFPISEEDLDTDARFWAGVLGGYGIGRGSNVVFSAFNYEMPWMHPARCATMNLGGAYSNVEHWGWDARRLELFCRRINPQMLFGIGGDNIRGLAGIVDVEEALAPVKHVLVRPDALGELSEVGLAPAGIVKWLGPAVAVSMPDGSGIGFDESQWHLESIEDVLHVSSRAERAASFDQQSTGVRGTVEKTDRGLRLHLDEVASLLGS
jgi:hypothetical protein